MTKEQNDYKVCIWGATVSKHEANKIGLSLIIGFLGTFLSILILGIRKKIAIFVILFALAAFGYFFVAKKVFRQNK